MMKKILLSILGVLMLLATPMAMPKADAQVLVRVGGRHDRHYHHHHHHRYHRCYHC